MSVRKCDRNLSPTEYWKHYVNTVYPYFANKLSHVSKRRRCYVSDPLVTELTNIHSYIAQLPFIGSDKSKEMSEQIVKGLLDLEPYLYRYWSAESIPLKTRDYQVELINSEIDLMCKQKGIICDQRLSSVDFDRSVLRELVDFTITKFIGSKDTPYANKEGILKMLSLSLYRLYKYNDKEGATVALRALQNPLLMHMHYTDSSEETRKEWIYLFNRTLDRLKHS